MHHTPLEHRAVLVVTVLALHRRDAPLLRSGGFRWSARRSVQSKAKPRAVRANGEPGGRPRRYPACPRYPNKTHRFATSGRCACGYHKPWRALSLRLFLRSSSSMLGWRYRQSLEDL